MIVDALGAPGRVYGAVFCCCQSSLPCCCLLMPSTVSTKLIVIYWVFSSLGVLLALVHAQLWVLISHGSIGQRLFFLVGHLIIVCPCRIKVFKSKGNRLVPVLFRVLSKAGCMLSIYAHSSLHPNQVPIPVWCLPRLEYQTTLSDICIYGQTVVFTQGPRQNQTFHVSSLALSELSIQKSCPSTWLLYSAFQPGPWR